MGTFTVALTATNAGGTGNATLTITVGKAVPVLTVAEQSVDNQNLVVTPAMLPTAAAGVAGLPAPTGSVTYTGSYPYQGGTITVNPFTPDTFGGPAGYAGIPTLLSPVMVTAHYAGDANYAAATKTVAFRSRDTLAPTVPTGLARELLGPNSFSLKWNSSTDASAQGGIAYEVSLDNGSSVQATAARPAHGVNGIAAGGTYAVRVRAKDIFGNTSAWSGAVSVTTPLSGDNPAAQAPWLDVDGDGIRDEIFPANSAAFTHSIVETRSQTITVEDWQLNYQTQIVFGPEGQIYFYHAWVPEWTSYNITLTDVRPEMHILAEPGYEYAVYRAISPTQYQRVWNPSVLEEGATSAPHIVTFDFWPEQAFFSAPLVLARLGKPAAGVTLNGAVGTILNSLGGTRGLGGTASLTLPASGGLVLSVKDVFDKVLQHGPKIVWEVWDAVNNIQVGTSTLGDTLDIGINGAGQWQVGMKQDDKPTVWFKATVQPVPSVQIVDKNKNSTSQLKVAKMIGDDVLFVNAGQATLYPDEDPDRFYIRVIDPSRRGQNPKVVVWTEAPSPGVGYSDDAYPNKNQIQLEDDPTDSSALISKSMLLVSDDPDDNHQQGGIPDDDLGDRTRKVALGGKVRVEYLGHKPGYTGTPDAEADVPVRAQKTTVNVKVVILRDTVGGELVTTQSSVEADIARMKERFAQVGVRLTCDVILADPPAGVDLTDGGLRVEAQIGVVPAEARALISGLGTTSTNLDLHVFYVNELQALSPASGFSIIDSFFGASEDSFTYNAFIRASRNSLVLAHELGHLLTDAGHIPPSEGNGQNLMVDGGVSSSTWIGGTKRLNPTQEAQILNNARTKN